MVAPPDAAPDAPAKQPTVLVGMRIIAVWFVLKLLWDVTLLCQSWPEFSRPKLGIAITLPFLAWGMWRQRSWSLSIAGVVCLFWMGYLVARLLGPWLTIQPVTDPFPWGNIAALPILIYLLNNIERDTEDQD